MRGDNDAPDGEQLRLVGCVGLHADHRCAQKARTVQNYPQLLADIFKITN